MLILMCVGSLSALGQTPSVAEQALKARQEALEMRKAGSARNVSLPNMSTDFLAALQTLGIRPGMTLRQATDAAAQWGAHVKNEPGYSDLGMASRDLTRESSSSDAAFGYFRRHTTAMPNYRGAGSVFILGREREAMPGSVFVHVYPLDPFGDILDPDKLIVYYIVTSIRGGTEVMTEAEFSSRGAPLIGGKLILKTSKVHDSKSCEFAERHPEQIWRWAQTNNLPAQYQPAAWPKCGDTTVVQLHKGPNNKGAGYNVWRFDLSLARKAYETFSQYGSAYRASIKVQQQ